MKYRLNVKTYHKQNGDFDFVKIDGQYLIYSDGCIYDTIYADKKDIPMHVFQFRDFILSQIGGLL